MEIKWETGNETTPKNLFACAYTSFTFVYLYDDVKCIYATVTKIYLHTYVVVYIIFVISLTYLNYLCNCLIDFLTVVFFNSMLTNSNKLAQISTKNIKITNKRTDENTPREIVDTKYVIHKRHGCIRVLCAALPSENIHQTTSIRPMRSFINTFKRQNLFCGRCAQPWQIN